MSENLQTGQQGSSTTSPTSTTNSTTRAQQRRNDRQSSSCTECRRRKQKCSQGNPCTNCARRFPQPICDYGPRVKTSKRTGTKSDSPAAKVVSQEGPYPHLNLAGVQEAILQLESTQAGPGAGVQKGTDEFAPLTSAADLVSFHDPSQYALGDQFSGHLRNWLPFRLVVHDQYGQVDNRKSILAALKAILERQNGNNTRLTPENEWMADAARLIWAAQGSQAPMSSLQQMDQELRHLPMTPTKLNKELVRTHLRLLSRFKACISGIPNPDNPFMKHWVPYIIQDPLLINIVLFTSACFLNETGHLPKSVVAALRGIVYQSLNENLRSARAQSTDAAILAVAEMVLDEWYWGGTQDLHAHMSGLRTMISMRGGLQDLGMHGLISKMVLTHDICMALSHEAQPDIYGRPGFEFNDPIMVPFQMSLNSPLATGWPSFTSCAPSLRLHPCTAMILDDVRTMVEAVLALPPDASSAQLQQASSVASWVYGRIGELPDNVPMYQIPQTRGSPAEASSSDTSSPPNTTDNSKPSPSNEGSSKFRSPQSANARRVSVATSSVRMQGSSPAKTEPIDRGSPPTEIPDPVYRMVRMVATIYCRAILSRAPTSMVCSAGELLQIWGLSWRIPMASRSSILGIYLWTMLSIAPSCHSAAPARFIKTLFVNGFLTAAVENWHVAIGMADSALKLQRWLKGSTTSKSLVFGGERAIEKHGFAVKEVLQNISTVHKGNDAQDENEDHDVDM